MATTQLDTLHRPAQRGGVDASAGGGASPTSGQILVRVLEADAEFASLEGAWERLQAQAAVTSVFASFDWQYLWWKAYGGGRPLRLLLAERAGEVVGILPLYVATERILRWPVRLLRLVGTGGDTSPEYLGPVLAAGREAEVACALGAAVLGLGGWDALDLQDVDPESPFATEIAVAARRRGLRCRTGRAERISFVALPESSDAWLASFSHKRRSRLKRMRRALLEAHPDARFFEWKDAASLDQCVDRLIDLHRRKWEGTGVAHGFSSAEYVAFHRAVIGASLARGRLGLYCLEIGGEIAAVWYTYRFRGGVFTMQTGYDAKHADLSPGLVLLVWIIEQAIEQKLRVVDFLRGGHLYKQMLANGERETVWLTALRRSPGGAIFGAARLVLPAWKARVARALGLRGRREDQGSTAGAT